MTNQINYFAVEIPEKKSPGEYSYTERRADLLHRILEAGSPTRINQYDAADEYDVTQGTILKDIDALSDSTDETIGGHAKITTRAAFDHVLEELYEADDWRATKAAWDVVMGWDAWLGDVGEQERAADQSEVDMAVSDDGSVYEVVHGAAEEPSESNNRDPGFTAEPGRADGEGGEN